VVPRGFDPKAQAGKVPAPPITLGNLATHTSGLPREVLALIKPGFTLSIPMRAGNRSLNLNNAVAVVVYEAWRQNDYALKP